MAELARVGGPEAIALVTTVLEQGAREREWIEEGRVSGLEADVAHWRERALKAERRLSSIANFFETLVWGDGGE